MRRANKIVGDLRVYPFEAEEKIGGWFVRCADVQRPKNRPSDLVVGHVIARRWGKNGPLQYSLNLWEETEEEVEVYETKAELWEALSNYDQYLRETEELLRRIHAKGATLSREALSQL
tara:strand:+ start:1904 stop:2257 length:354 start_codon:yes stop_codon:yes gene_type:complete